MITVYNIRGTNGSGKSTLARSFIAGDPAALPNRPGVEGSPTMVDLVSFSAPTQKLPDRRRFVEGYALNRHDLKALVVGSYRTSCGGLDGIDSFDRQFRAIRQAVRIMTPIQLREGNTPCAVLCEGVIASTVWGSWGRFADELKSEGKAQMAFCYLDTPLEVCLERIRRRQEAAGKVREIKTELVADKIRAIAATREKALAAEALVYDLPYETAASDLASIMKDDWVMPRGSIRGCGSVQAREMFRA